MKSEIITYDAACEAAVSGIMEELSLHEKPCKSSLQLVFLDTFRILDDNKDGRIAELESAVRIAVEDMSRILDQMEPDLTCPMCGKLGYHTSDCQVGGLRATVNDLESVLKSDEE